MIAFGFALFGICSIWFGQVYLGIGPWTLVWAIILSGFGSGCVFVPLSTTTMAGLKNEEIGNASGLYNLLRNIGGSVGISIVNTIISRHTQSHRSELVRSITDTNHNYQQQSQAIQHAMQFAGTGGSGPSLYGPATRALGIVNGMVDQQARLWSYVDDFRYLALVCFACVPIVFMLKKAVAKKGAVGAAH
jgi:DHA2 family multidrug resistance protein